MEQSRTVQIRRKKQTQKKSGGKKGKKVWSKISSCHHDDHETFHMMDPQPIQQQDSDVYVLENDLRVFNELKAPVWISTFADQQARFVWANIAALLVWNKPTVEAFTSMDISTGRSQAVLAIHQELWTKVQVPVDGKVVGPNHSTMYPGEGHNHGSGTPTNRL